MTRYMFISGGLAAVIYTDTLQTAIMTIGAFALIGISMYLDWLQSETLI